jgi:hypothetical protein
MTPPPPARPDSRAPKLAVDVPAITARRRAILAARTVDQFHNALFDSANDVPLLVAELSRLGSHLLRLRLRYANLEAAARAAVAAERDGEPDPLAYLADELAGEWPAAAPSTMDSR